MSKERTGRANDDTSAIAPNAMLIEREGPLTATVVARERAGLPEADREPVILRLSRAEARELTGELLDVER